MVYSAVHDTFSCDYSKVAQSLHGKQLAFHYLLDLKEKMQKRRTQNLTPVHFVVQASPTLAHWETIKLK